MPFHQGRLAAPFMRPCSPAPSRATYSAAMERIPWHPSNTVARGAGADPSAALIDRQRRRLRTPGLGGVVARRLCGRRRRLANAVAALEPAAAEGRALRALAIGEIADDAGRTL